MTDHYVVQVELDRIGLSDELVDELYAALGDWSLSAAEAHGRHVQLTLTVPAESLRQAVTTALSLVDPFGRPTVVTSMTETVWDQRADWLPLPPLVSVPEAAQILGFSRQYVHQLIEEGKLPATRVGRDNVIVKSALAPFLPEPAVEA